MQNDGGEFGELIGHILVSPFEIARERQQRWRMLDPVEQNLRRASRGALLAVSTVVVIYFFDLVPAFLKNPAEAWPPLAVAGVVLFCALLRSYIGARRCAGVRDGLRAATAFARLAAGVAAIVWLWPYRAAVEGIELLPPEYAIKVAAVAFVIASLVIIGGVRLAVLSWRPGAALGMVTHFIKTTEFSWDDDRPWWQFWRRRP